MIDVDKIACKSHFMKCNYAYDIPSQVLGEEVETMCNLGEGIWEDALENGLAQGREENLLELISKKLAKGKSLSQIADECEETEERIQELMKKL